MKHQCYQCHYYRNAQHMTFDKEGGVWSCKACGDRSSKRWSSFTRKFTGITWVTEAGVNSRSWNNKRDSVSVIEK